MKRSRLVRKTPMKRGRWRKASPSDLKAAALAVAAAAESGRPIPRFRPTGLRWLPAKRRKPMKRTRLKAVSAKQAVLRQLWHEKRDAHLDSHPFCELNLGIKGCPRSKPHKAHDVHHSKGRGRFLLDESTYKSACRTGHNWVHSHTKAARKLGLFNP